MKRIEPYPALVLPGFSIPMEIKTQTTHTELRIFAYTTDTDSLKVDDKEIFKEFSYVSAIERNMIKRMERVASLKADSREMQQYADFKRWFGERLIKLYGVKCTKVTFRKISIDDMPATAGTETVLSEHTLLL